MSAAPDDPRDTIERPHLGWWISIFFGMTLLGILAFHGASFALWCEHVTTLLPKSVLQITFVIAVLLHVGEAIFANRIVAGLGMNKSAGAWTLQTALLGFPSLRILLARRRAATERGTEGLP